MKKISVLFFLVYFFGCKDLPKETDESHFSDLKNKVIVILDSIPEMKVYYTPTGGEFRKRDMCSYVNDDFEEYNYLYPDILRNDTIIINTSREFIDFKVYFLGGMSSVDFALKNQNIYHIGYKDTVPYVMDNTDYDGANDYIQTLYHSVYEDKISSMMKMDDFAVFAFTKGKERFPTQQEIDQAIPGILEKVQNETQWQQLYIDSLYSLGKIGKEQYHIFMNEVVLNRYLFNQNIKENRFFGNFRNAYRRNLDSIAPLVADSSSYLDYNIFNLTCAYNHINRYFYMWDNESIGVLSDSLKQLNLNESFIKIAISKYLDDVYASFPWELIKKNTQKYLHSYPDSKLPGYLMAKYNIDTTNVNDVKLINKVGSQTTLSNVLSGLRGSDIVLDVWASWCAPCIEQIKSGKEERGKAAKDGTIQVFITFYDEKSEWLKRIKEIGLENEEYSFFTTNSQTSQWFKEMKISSIPTVIYYDKTGGIVKIVN